MPSPIPTSPTVLVRVRWREDVIATALVDERAPYHVGSADDCQLSIPFDPFEFLRVDAGSARARVPNGVRGSLSLGFGVSEIVAGPRDVTLAMGAVLRLRLGEVVLEASLEPDLRRRRATPNVSLAGAATLAATLVLGALGVGAGLDDPRTDLKTPSETGDSVRHIVVQADARATAREVARADAADAHAWVEGVLVEAEGSAQHVAELASHALELFA